MKKCDYSDLQAPKDPEERRLELEQSKLDEQALPEFTLEVPTAASRSEGRGRVTLDFEWAPSRSHHIRAASIAYRRGETGIEELYRVDARDGTDSVCTRRGGKIYILRRASREVAEALLNSYGRIKGALENVVGWLRSVLGNFYVISTVEHGCWSFDRRISKDAISHVDIERLGGGSRKKLFELLTEKISELHSGAVVLGNFTLNNVVLTHDSLEFTDLRNMRATRKRHLAVEEFKKVMQYLFAIGVAERADIYQAAAYYATVNEDACREWYIGRTGKRPGTAYQVVRKLEDDL